jgi:hypothetical protein
MSETALCGDQLVGWATTGEQDAAVRTLVRRRARGPADEAMLLEALGLAVPADLPAVDEHGSPARERKHYRDGEKPCEKCRGAAHRARRRLRQKTPGAQTPGGSVRLSDHGQSKTLTWP